MRTRTALFPLCRLLLGTQTAFSAGMPGSEQPIEIRWSELGAYLAGGDLLGRGEAMLVLPDGTIVRGQILGVEKDELALKVSRSSDKRAYPKRPLSIPRSSVTTIRLTQTKSAKGRIIGTLAGILGGAAIGTAVALSQPDNTGGSGAVRGGVVALWVGTGVAGYYAGRSLDRKTTLVKVLPD